MNKKKKIIGIAAGVVVLCGAAGGIFLMKGNDKENNQELAYVMAVSSMNQSFGPQSFAGVVEPQQTWDIQKSPDKKVKEILVKVGDQVEPGTELFNYDTDEMNTELSQAMLDLERMDNKISSLQAQIAQLEKEKRQASSDAQLSYTTQIQEAQLELKGAEYDKKSKEVEKAQLENSIENATVVSDTTGIVKSINESGETNMYTGETQAFMTILATGSYRVKAKINEQNIGEVQEGMPAIVSSRIDENQIWQGTFSAIDKDEPVSGNNEMYYGMAMGSEEMSTSSSYYFYVNLDSSDGLMLGQHVYIKKAETGEEKKGLWISEGYLSDLESKPYVWAEKDGKLEKREVELGEYDEMMMEYQITGGLENSDYIAFPQEFLEEGMKTTHEDIAMMGGDMMEESMEGEEIMVE